MVVDRRLWMVDRGWLVVAVVGRTFAARRKVIDAEIVRRMMVIAKEGSFWDINDLRLK